MENCYGKLTQQLTTNYQNIDRIGQQLYILHLATMTEQKAKKRLFGYHIVIANLAILTKQLENLLLKDKIN